MGSIEEKVPIRDGREEGTQNRMNSEEGEITDVDNEAEARSSTALLSEIR